MAIKGILFDIDGTLAAEHPVAIFQDVTELLGHLDQLIAGRFQAKEQA